MAANATSPSIDGAGWAATVVLLRDGERGVEVLLAERPSGRGSFAGAWVFPGGVVEPADVAGDEISGIEAARRAAVRETREEVGLEVETDELVPIAVWTPPQGSPKPLTTTFFAVRMPDGDLALAPDEVVAAEWVRPGDALERHAAGTMLLWPPTWVTAARLQERGIRRRGARRARRRRRARLPGPARRGSPHGALAGGRRVRPGRSPGR